MMDKSHSARLIAMGLGRESFQHETLGHFDISALRELITGVLKAEPGLMPVRHGRYDQLLYEGEAEKAYEHVVSNREVDPARCRELTDEQLNEPLIFLNCPAGTNGEGDTQLLVDGIHRFVERRTRGMEGFDFYMIPLAVAPRVDGGLYTTIPWGEKEVVPGKGLVRRGG
jgi:hypothetical protein